MLHEMTHVFQYKMLFQGNLAQGGRPPARPPGSWRAWRATWRKDESQRDKMYLRDAVVNDTSPRSPAPTSPASSPTASATRSSTSSRSAGARKGSSTSSTRSATPSASRVDRAVKRAFKLDAGGLRHRVPALAAQEVPAGAGQDRRALGLRPRLPHRGRAAGGGPATSPVASPSGDLVAALSVYRGKVDVVLYDTKSRKLLRNLTKGYLERLPVPGRRRSWSLGRQLGARHRLLAGRQHGRRLRQARAGAEPAADGRAQRRRARGRRDGRHRAAGGPRLLAGRQDGRLLRLAQRPVRHLPPRPRHQDDHQLHPRRGLRRRPHLLARRPLAGLRLHGAAAAARSSASISTIRASATR